MSAVMWFRRDLRLADNPALLEAASAGDVLALFVLDPALWGPAGPSRRAYLGASLRSLDASLRGLGGSLSVVRGDPVRRVVLAAKEVGADTVHVAADYGPYGRRRDEEVESALADAGIELVRTGSPYAVAPGRIVNGSQQPYQVFTPFSRAWADHGWRDPAGAPDGIAWLALDGSGQGGALSDIPDPALPSGLELPEAGEDVARGTWTDFLDRVEDYAADRDKPGVEGTSRMSRHLKYGEVHPRTLLADLAGRSGKGVSTYRTELAWREFYADVLHRRPDSAREYYKPQLAAMPYDPPGDQLETWKEGRTGFPIVDAGMRQLRATGWMHNRLRMIVASFLVKDLHVEWQHGAAHFLHWLVDGDLSSNNHGWQWTAGSGTDASPYFRVFNPTTQGRRFDAAGDYVRRWVEELADPERVPDPHDPDPDTRDLVGYPVPDGRPPCRAPGGARPLRAGEAVTRLRARRPRRPGALLWSPLLRQRRLGRRLRGGLRRHLGRRRPGLARCHRLAAPPASPGDLAAADPHGRRCRPGQRRRRRGAERETGPGRPRARPAGPGRGRPGRAGRLRRAPLPPVPDVLRVRDRTRRGRRAAHLPRPGR